MQVTIENFCGVKSAAFPMTGITLVAGDNGQGKSSIAKAVAAVLSGAVIPVPGVLKNMAGMLVHEGAAKGSAVIETTDGVAQIEWPRATLKTKGTPPAASLIATGLESLAPPPGAVDSTALQKRRTELFVELLNATPTRDDLAAYLKPHGIGEDTIGNLWEVISKNNWDAAHNQAKETGARLKGQWEVTAGDRYGSKKAETFVPNDWEPELAGASEDALKGAVSDARDALDGMIAITAVDDAEQQRLQAEADQLADREAAYHAADAELVKANGELQEIANRLQFLQDPSLPRQLAKCPHCNQSVKVLNTTSLEKPREFTEQDSEQYQTVKGQHEACKEVCDERRRVLSESERALQVSRQSASKISSAPNGNATQSQVDAARNALALAERRLAAYSTKTKADRINSAIGQNVIIVSALDMTGVRQSKLGACVQGFLDSEVQALAAVAGWLTVGVDADMAITYGGRAWSLLSESERFRVRVLLQVAIARREQSAAIVIDAADILGKPGRNGLMKMLKGVQIPTLVCMTINAVTDMPNLKAARLGDSFWIERGVLQGPNEV